MSPIGYYWLHRKKAARFLLAGCCVAFVGLLLTPSLLAAPVSFERDVRPILAAHCLKCHGEKSKKGGLDLRSAASIRVGGDSGPAINASAPEKSLLLEQITSQAMPPGKAKKLSAAEIQVIREWIRTTPAAETAPAGPRHWAFQPPKLPVVPLVRDTTRFRTPIDRFILTRLEARGLSFSPEVDPRTLIRRATFDLLGLPPTPEETAAFVDACACHAQASSKGPDPYEQLIDRLLASPHYGERWGRHWLDAAGYADTSSADNDLGIVKVHEGMWRYRDWVVRSINEDEPFDRFLTEQLAGDELVDWRSAPRFTPVIRDSLIATAFLRNAVDCSDEMELNRPIDRQEVLTRNLELLGSCVLGLTLDCARCHNHKYDPIPQADYYRLLACLTPAYNPTRWRQPKDRLLLDESPVALAEHRLRLARIVGQLAGTARTLGGRLAGASPLFEAGQRFAGLARIPVLWEDGPPPQTPILKRGSLETLGAVVQPGFLRALGRDDFRRPTETQGPSSGRRLALAKWLTDPRHPLTARVWVNRLWQHHFGKGLVATPDNLGIRGATPTHPELLDWLATEAMAGGWKAKRLHRLIMTSTVYRQSSRRSADDADPGNDLLGRMPLRRLEAEAVRDAILTASGRLDRTLGGPAVPLDSRADGMVTVSAKAAVPGGSQRRSLYLTARRNYPVSLLDAFDFPVMGVNCTRRSNTATPLQSLGLLNNEFVAAQAEAFAARLLAEAGSSIDQQIDRAFRLALGRTANSAEMRVAGEHVHTQTIRFQATGDKPDQAARRALAGFCQMLYCTNEFLYVD